jgi:hypothetical protein
MLKVDVCMLIMAQIVLLIIPGMPFETVPVIKGYIKTIQFNYS